MNLIVAADEHMGIAHDHHLPWPRLPRESKHFLKVTTKTTNPAKHNAVIFDKADWDIIPANHRPLKDRLNVVIDETLSPADVPSGVQVFKNFDEAMNYLYSPSVSKDLETIWNVGGTELFKLGLDHPAFNRLYLTRILGEYDSDTFFPHVEWELLKRIEDSEVPPDVFGVPVFEENGVRYQYEIYERAF